jgi:hypothetical protein
MTVKNSRLISSFEVVAGANTIVLSSWDGSGGTYTATISPGTYYFSNDDASDDIIKELNDQLDTAVSSAGSWNIGIVGVTVSASGSASGYAEGRLKWVADGNAFTIDVSACTFPMRTLGIDVDQGDIVTNFANSYTYYTDWVHRYGWYPQDATLVQDIRTVALTNVRYTSGRYLDGIDDGEYENAHFGWDRIHPALSTIYDATLSSATDQNLTQSDPNCPFERWALDLSRDTTRRFRWYPEIDDEDTYKGPYAFSDQSSLWFDPLLAAPITEAAGKRRTVIVDGMEVNS